MKMSYFTNLSIRNKLVFIIISTSVVAIIVGLILSVSFDMFKVRKELKANALFYATLVGQYSAAPLIFEYNEEAGDILAKLESIPSVIDACLYYPQWEGVFASYHRNKKSTFSFPSPRTENLTFSKGYLEVFHTIYYKNQYCGIIYFRMSTGDIRDRFVSHILFTGVIIVLLITVVSIIASRLQKLISGPILNLATITQKISEDDEYKEKLKYSGNDEINTLYRHFDNMLHQIFQRKRERDEAEKQLEILNAQLRTDLEERTRMESTLRISEERYRYLFDRNPAPMAIYDKETHFVLTINEAFLNTYGYSVEEVKKMNLQDFYPPEEKGPILDLVKGLRGHAKTGEWHHIKKDGSLMGVITTSHDIVYMGKNARVVVITDITERQKAEKEISFLAQVLKNINEIVSITDTKNNISFVNQSWLKIFGYTVEEVMGKNISLIVSPSNRTGIVKEILDATLNGGWQGELINRRKDGSEFPVFLSTSIIYDKENMPVALVGISTDITEQKKIQEELINHRNNLERLVQERTKELDASMIETRDLYENAPCGYHSINEKGKFVRINKTELNWLGYSSEELVNKKGPMDVMTLASREIFKNALSELINKGEIQNIEYEYVRKDGSSFFGSLSATSIYDEKGRFQLSRSTLFDITERKRMEIELHKAMEAAESANKAKSEFLANMSHEIRTPMNAVLGYTELLSSLLTDQNQRNYIESIKSSGRGLLTLINDILDLSKIEAGKLELEFDYIDSRQFFTEFEKIFALKATDKGIKFLVEISSGTPSGIYVDEPRLRQIIFNLVGNAVKFTRQGYVKLKVRTDNLQTVRFDENKSEDYVDLVIEVEDTGTGISREIREEIFDPFMQARDLRNIGGTGLGLSITQRLTTLMKGTISLKSELGKGSTFTVKIPDVAFKSDFYKASLALTIDPSEIVFENATILVVDDVEFNRSYISDALKETNIRVIEAEDGFKALELSKAKIPDLIISDIRMPNMDGFELLRKIKSDKDLERIPVLAYSASVLKDQKEKIHKSKFSGLLTKPVNLTELYAELMNFIPYKEIKKTTINKEDSAEIRLSEIENPRELVKKLESSFKDIWKTFEIRQPIGEVKEFGDALVTLGKKHYATVIINYGRDLKNAAEGFNIKAIISLIKKYPVIVESLKAN